CSLDSVNDARRVCEQLRIPHYVLNLESRFGHDVVDNFVDEYSRGRTPIPCVRCNTFTKFRDFLKKADAIDARWIATGHYARVIDGELRRGVDENKDQTYFLWGIDRSVLSRMLLPVGDLDKATTRARARHRAALARGEIVRLDGDELEIALDEPISAITPGQSVVLYDGERVLGGGFIESARQQRNSLPVLAA